MGRGNHPTKNYTMMTTQATQHRLMTKLQALNKCARLMVELEKKGYNVTVDITCHDVESRAFHFISLSAYNWRLPASQNRCVDVCIYLPVTHAEFDEKINKFINEVNDTL